MPRTAAAFLVFLCLWLPACGVGGTDPGASLGTLPNATLAIQNTSLPNGSTAVAYPATQMVAVNAQGAVSWQELSGALPGGITLSPSGLIEGQATTLGSFAVEIEVSDGARSASRAYTIVIAEFSFVVTSGLIGSDAWEGAPLTLETIGASGNVTFSFEANNSGGNYSDSNSAAGTATYVPGSTTGVTDVLRATNAATGEFATLDVSVEVNPAPQMIARFGTTDVWYIDTDAKRGSHARRTDFLQACADARLLPATGPASSPALESLVEVTMRKQVLRELNLIFLRDDDGSDADGSGTLISFPFVRPDENTYTAPSQGGILGGSSTRFSILEFADLSALTGVLGRAMAPGDNSFHENNGGPDPDSQRLGTFTNAVTASFLSWQSGTFSSTTTVSIADIDVIEDILYDRTSGIARVGRQNELRKLMQWFARAFAIVAAHEMGHSLGFAHNSTSDSLLFDSIGFSDGALSTSNAVQFLSSEVTTLKNSALPGPGRSSNLTARTATEAPEPIGTLSVAAAQAP